MSMTEQRFESHDGLSLFYRDYDGDAARCPVICLPGLTRNSRDFEDFAPHVASGRRVLSPDLRGRGFSERDPEWRNYHPATYVADTWRLMDELGIERVVLVGTSLGGLISMRMGAAHPERIAGIVLNDVGPEIAPEGLARVMSYAGRLEAVEDWAGAAAQAKAVYGLAMDDIDETMWLRMARRGYREDETGKPVIDADPNIGVALREIGPTGDPPWVSFESLGDLPVLVLRGEHSDILSTEIVERMREIKPDLEVVEIANRGHVPLLDEADSLAAIDRFLERMP